MERMIDCRLADCVKEFGEWANEGQCQIVGANKLCAPGLQRQIRICKDGESNKCTQHDTLRLIPCRQNDTEIICEGKLIKILGYWITCYYIYNQNVIKFEKFLLHV